MELPSIDYFFFPNWWLVLILTARRLLYSARKLHAYSLIKMKSNLINRVITRLFFKFNNDSFLFDVSRQKSSFLNMVLH